LIDEFIPYLEDHPRTFMWLGWAPIYKPFGRPFGMGINPILRGLTISMVINHWTKSWDDALQIQGTNGSLDGPCRRPNPWKNSSKITNEPFKIDGGYWLFV